MKQPPFLKEGEDISLIAPSFGITSEPYITRFSHSLNTFKRLGYKVHLGKNVYRAEGLLASAGGKERAEEFLDAYQSDSSLLLSVGGGERERDILPYLDFSFIEGLKPKWFRGSSDNTNLAFLLTTLSKVRTVYSSNAPSFFSYPPSYSEKDALRRLKGEKEFKGYPFFSPPRETDNPLAPLARKEKKIITPYRYSSPVKGVRIGGCLDCLLTLCGTEFDRVSRFGEEAKHGLIFYLESCDLNPRQIYRGLFQLRHAHWFEKVSLFLIGRPLCQKREVRGLDADKAVLSALADLKKPILLNVDLGHIPPSLPFKNGATALVSYKDNNLFIRYRD